MLSELCCKTCLRFVYVFAICLTGAFYDDATSNTSKIEDGILKGQSATLTWKMDADFSPRDDDANCIPFAYHSHKNPDLEVNSGLVGLLVICKQGIESS